MTTSSFLPADGALLSLSGPATTAEDPVPEPLGVVGALLRERGWAARTQVLTLCGDVDVRLRVLCPGSPVQVELLGPPSRPAAVEGWCAVRITGQRRVVWRGPRRGCSPEELVRFVEALGAGDMAQAHQDYRALS